MNSFASFLWITQRSKIGFSSRTKLTTASARKRCWTHRRHFHQHTETIVSFGSELTDTSGCLSTTVIKLYNHAGTFTWDPLTEGGNLNSSPWNAQETKCFYLICRYFSMWKREYLNFTTESKTLMAAENRTKIHRGKQNLHGKITPLQLNTFT